MEQAGTKLVSFFVVENTGQEVLVSPVLDERPTFIIGSDARNPLRLDDPSVESAHAMVTLKDGDTFIQPRYPKAEVRVNGKSIKAATRLNPGDVVGIGETRLRFEQEERRVQVPVGAPAVQISRPTMALIPARTTSLVQPIVPPSEIIPAGERVIYRPKRVKETQRANYARLLGIIAVVVVVVALGYYVYSALNASVVEGRPVDYAYDDGNVAVLVFDINGCQECKDQETMVERVVRDYRGDVYLQSYNLSCTGNRYLIDKYELVSPLAVIVLDDQGQVFAKFGGGIDETTLRQAFEMALQQSATN